MEECSNTWKTGQFKVFFVVVMRFLKILISFRTSHSYFVKIIRVYLIIACPMVFIVLWNWCQQGRVIKPMVLKFAYFWLSGLSSRRFWAGERVTCIKNAWNYKYGTFSWMRDGFYFPLWSRLAGRSAKTYEKWSILGIFSRLGR